MFNKIAVFVFLAVFLYACQPENAAKEKQSYTAAKIALLQKEEKNPSAFIAIRGNSKKNIVGQTVVRGTLVNRASVAIYKDVEIQLNFYSKTDALLETDKETVFEILNPGESQDFKTKYFAPKGTDSVGLKVVTAKIIQQSLDQ